MPLNVDNLLDQRRARAAEGRGGSFAISVAFHVTLTAAFLFLPGFFKEPRRQIEYVTVAIVSPAVLGQQTPAPPPPPPEPEPEPEPEPVKLPPTPPVKPAADVPVIKTEKAPEPKAEKAPPTPPRRRRVEQRPPRRQGSTRGQSLGASTSKAAVGAEDPNFTYDWYLAQVVRQISDNWTPPLDTTEIQAVFYFRILRDGTVTSLELRQPSAQASFDQAARLAIEASSPLPPLPQAYKPEYLGINLRFK